MHATSPQSQTSAMPNAFCVDLEEWFHICAADTPYNDPSTWHKAPALVERDTEGLMRLLDEEKTHGTFLTVGWIAERYPRLVKRLADAGHEIGCHTYYHRVIYEQKPAEFEEDLIKALTLLRQVSGQAVDTFRAPGFSMKRECFWAYNILRRHGVTVDVSIVPATRGHGGISDFQRDCFRLQTDEGSMVCFPVSVMSVAGKRVPFSGGGYLRLFPMSLVHWGCRQNLRDGRPVMTYIHPREISSDQPRLKLPWRRYFQYYINLDSTIGKLRELLQTYRFTTVHEVIAAQPSMREFRLTDRDIVEMPNAHGAAMGN